MKSDEGSEVDQLLAHFGKKYLIFFPLIKTESFHSSDGHSVKS